MGSSGSGHSPGDVFGEGDGDKVGRRMDQRTGTGALRETGLRRGASLSSLSTLTSARLPEARRPRGGCKVVVGVSEGVSPIAPHPHWVQGCWSRVQPAFHFRIPAGTGVRHSPAGSKSFPQGWDRLGGWPPRTGLTSNSTE